MITSSLKELLKYQRNFDAATNSRKGFVGLGWIEAVRVCENGKVLNDAPALIKKQTTDDLSIMKSRGSLNAAPLPHCHVPAVVF